MAEQASNKIELDFGVFTAATTVTHWRISRGSVVYEAIALSSPLVVPANSGVAFRVGALRIKLLTGQATLNQAARDILGGRFGMSGSSGGNSFHVDLMTDATTVVATQGYAQAGPLTETDGWTLESVAD